MRVLVTIFCLFLASQAAWAGRLEGKVRLGADGEKVRLDSPVSDPACGAEPIVDKTTVVEETEKLLPFTVVTLRPKRSTVVERALPTELRMEQRGCEFLPFVLLAAPGATLTVSNDDPTLHNVHLKRGRTSLSNVAQPKGAAPLVMKIEGTGPVKVDCDVHYWMKGWVYVSTDPVGMVTDRSGEFWFDVPAGRYALTAWHPAWGEVVRNVTVLESGTTEFTVQLP